MPNDIHAQTSPLPQEYGPPRNSEVVDISAADHAFSNPTTCLHVGVAGDIVVEELGTGEGVQRTYKNVEAGMFVGRFTKIIKTGTTATDIVGRW